MTTVTVRSSGNAPTAVSIPQQTAATTIPASTPLILDAAGHLIPSTGNSAPVAFSPAYEVVNGQSYTPQPRLGPVYNPAGGYTVGTDYYVQTTGALGTTVTAYYAGTAISSTMLSYSPLVDIAASTAPAIAPAVQTALNANTLGNPSNATTRKLLTNDELVKGWTAFTLTPEPDVTIQFSNCKENAIAVSLVLTLFVTANKAAYAPLVNFPAGMLVTPGIIGFNASSADVGTYGEVVAVTTPGSQVLAAQAMTPSVTVAIHATLLKM